MPTYEFKCPKCGKVDPVMRSIKEMDKPHVCSVCGTITRRTIGAPAGFVH